MKVIFISILLFLSSLSQLLAQDTTSRVVYSLFLIGDAGEPDIQGKDAVLNSLSAKLKQKGKKSAVVFLGDNIYPRGLVDLEHPDRKQSEERLSAQLDIIKSHVGAGYMIPGNHDWEQGGKNGWAEIIAQEKFVTEYLQNPSVFFPKGGCPTPQEVALTDSVTLVLLDTQWYLHPWKKPDENSDCEVKTLTGLLTSLDDILYRNRHKKVVVTGHHPMYSHSLHGGYYPFKSHILPFSELGINIPLPILGSIYPLYRSWIGNIQDIPNPVYQEMRNGMVKIMAQYPNVLYANGHEHTLQLIEKDSLYYITSGAGSKTTPVKKGTDSYFAASKKGFAQLDWLADGQTKIYFWDENGKLLYEKNLTFKKKPFQELVVKPNQQTIPNPKFKANKFKEWLLGKNYRSIWTRPVQAPMIDLSSEKGGLKVIQRGGGQQTLSLRYEGKDQNQYVTRSVEKYPESAVPEAIRSKFTVDIVGDQISASHPFAALTIPSLAEAARVLHTNPRLVRLPNDTILGPYQRLFAGQLALFEERPDEGFAGAKKTYSTLKLFEKLEQDNKNVVDQKAMLRARLLDMLIGDWDRHDDQWRWAAYDEGKQTVFRAIPRDRDQAFFVSQGILPRIVSRKWILPKVQGFDYKIRDINTFNFNARYVDRAFLTELSLKDWENAVAELQHNISDSLIDLSVKKLPDNDPFAPEIAAKLKQRKKDLLAYASEYYRFLAKEVDIVASDKDEIVSIKRLQDGNTFVQVFDQTKKGKQGSLLYQRTFEPQDTKEIRIWGMDGEDVFHVEGIAHKGIKVRLIGGKGKDTFIDSSSVEKGGRKTIIYDKKKNTVIEGSAETVNNTTEGDKHINDLDRFAFVYDRLAPLGSLAYNPDDGVFIGGGIQYTQQGFRKSPFRFQHSLSGNYAFSTNAFNLYYLGKAVDIFGKTDLEIKINLQQEGLTDNFFGLSNESKYIQSRGIEYYRVKLSNLENSILLSNNYGPLKLYYGFVFNGYDVKENARRFIAEYAPKGSELYEEQDFYGIRAGFTVDTRNNPVMTTRGLKWNSELTFQKAFEHNYKDDYFNLKTDLAFYHTFKLPAVLSFATRVGGGINLLDYEFYQANTLGGLSNLRGYRRSRFSGKSSFYHNLEARLKLLSFKSYLFPAQFGILAFNDLGRVWNPNENSQKWHHGYGGGVWLSPFQMAVLTLTYGRSSEDEVISFKLGFFF